MKLSSWLGLTVPAFAVVLATATPASAGPAPLPAPNCGTVPGTNCLVFDDFTVYSLALLHLQTSNQNFGPQSPFYVPTNGNDIQNALVVLTGPNGQPSINSDVVPNGNADDANDNPNLGGPALSNFKPSSSNDGTAGANIANNSTSTWDVNVDALNTYLAGGQLQFYFNLNQTNSQATTYLETPQDALGWLAVTLADSSGANLRTFYLSGEACTGTLGLPGSTRCDPSQSYDPNAPGADPNSQILPTSVAEYADFANHDEWAYVHGKICASGTSGAVYHLGACDGSEPADREDVDQNLGATPAAFALVSDQLSFWLNSGFYDGGKMSVDVRLAAQTNGFEQLIILAGPATNIPEPITIGLFGAGLIGAGLLRRRRNKA